VPYSLDGEMAMPLFVDMFICSCAQVKWAFGRHCSVWNVCQKELAIQSTVLLHNNLLFYTGVSPWNSGLRAATRSLSRTLSYGTGTGSPRKSTKFGE
jgi:hypothetical protein